MRGHLTVQELIEAIDEMRSLCDVPAKLGLSTHPAMLAHQGAKPSQLLKPLAKVVYRCEVASAYQDVSDVGKLNLKRKAAQYSLNKKLCKEAESVKLSADVVTRRAMKDHFLDVSAEKNRFYSVKRSSFKVEGLMDSLLEPATKRMKLDLKMKSQPIIQTWTSMTSFLRWFVSKSCKQMLRRRRLFLWLLARALNCAADAVLLLSIKYLHHGMAKFV